MKRPAQKINVEKIAASLGDTPSERLQTMMARLRDPRTGCPWDIEQNFKTIAPYTVEEAYEVYDAIERGDMVDLKEELGDLLLQVVFHARMAQEQNIFDFNTISDALVNKMIARHPHVFGNITERDSKTQTQAWEAMKAGERAGKSKTAISALDGVANALPALMRAEKLQKRAARVGFDWAEPAQVLQKIVEEAGEIVQAKADGEPRSRIHEEVGDLIFAVTNLARKLGVDPEQALRDTNRKFTTRFQYMEQNADTGLENLSLEQLETLWVSAKTAKTAR